MTDAATVRRETPVVSVIIPTYRHQDYIGLTLEAVFAQTFTDREVIVVNDGSPDDTAARLRPLAAQGRIRYIEQQNGGQGAARNRGLSEARGEFVALLDDDDLWPPDKLAWQVQALRDHPQASVVYGRPLCIDGEGNLVPPAAASSGPLSPTAQMPSGDVYQAFMADNPLISPGLCLVRRAALATLGPNPFDPAMKGCDDWDVWLRLARHGRFLFVDRPALFYRLHGANASRDHLAMCRSSLALRRKQARCETDPVLRARWRRLSREAYSALATLLYADATGSGRVGPPAARAATVARALLMDAVLGVGKLNITGLRRLTRGYIDARALGATAAQTK